MNDLASRGISELGLSHLIYYGFVNDNKVFHVNINKMFTNCNEFYLDKVDKTETKMKITCIPIFELEKLTSTSSSPEKYNDAEYKSDLFNKAKSINLFDKFWMYFKPYSSTKPTKSIDWCNLSVGEDTLNNKQPHRLESASNRNNWLSNFDLRVLLKRYVIMRDKAKYLGVFYLQAFDGLKRREAIDEAIECSSVWMKTKEYMSNNDWHILLGHIVRKSHWSALIINKKHKAVFYFCSVGNDPKQYPKKWKNVYFYSNTQGFVKSSLNEPYPKRLKSMMMYKFLSMFTDLNYNVFMNVEQCQNLDGECGTFSSMFLLLYLLYDIRTHEQISMLYNFFRFFGDKKMSMLRSLLFVDFKSNETVKLDKREWIGMYEHLKRITTDIIRLIDNDINSKDYP